MKISKFKITAIVILIVFIFAALFIFNNKKVKISEVDEYFQKNELISYDKTLGEKLVASFSKDEKKKIEQIPGEIKNYKIIKANKLIRNKDCIILFFSKGEKSFITAFTKKTLEYKPLGIVDIFSYVEDIQYQQIRKENTNIIFVREVVDKLDSENEKGTFIKAYYYDNKFSLVLSLTEEYEIYSNNITDRWKKVYEKSDIKYTNEYYPVIEVLERQVDFVSEVTSQKKIPKKDMFDVINTRNIYTKYTWSDKYKHFIIGEGIEKTTGNKIAIVEDLHFESFFEIDELEKIREKYVVKYSDGSLKILSYGDVELVEEAMPLKLIN